MVRRGKHMYVYCKETPKHKQKQAFHTIINRSAEFCQPATIPSYTASFSFATAAPRVPATNVTEMLFCSPCTIPSATINPVSKFRVAGSAGVILA